MSADELTWFGRVITFTLTVLALALLALPVFLLWRWAL
jgi:hypothetical protein